MMANRIKFFYNNANLEAFLLPKLYHFKKAPLRNLICRRYSSKDDSVNSTALSVQNTQQNLQPIPRKNHKLSAIKEEDRKLVEILKKGEDPDYPYKGSYDKITTIMSDSFKAKTEDVVKYSTGIKLDIVQKPFYPLEVDIIIIGCNAVGLSIAYALREKCPDTPHVLVIDRDENFPHLSTNIGQSMITQQLFVDEEEIEMNKYAAEFLSAFPRLTEVDDQPKFNIPYEPLGSLVLADESNTDQVLQKIDTLKKHGIVTKILDNKALKMKFPWLKLDNVLFGSLGMCKEGMYDPWTFLNGLKCKAVNLGTKFMTAEVLDFGIDKYQTPVRLICRLPDGRYHPINFAYCIIAGGMTSLDIVNVLNNSNLGPLVLKLPLEERMRYEYCFYSPKGPGLDTPIVIDSDGTYFRREGLCNYYVAGVPNVSYDREEDIEPYNVFINKVKPFLAKRVPQFKEIDLVKGWIDSYDFCASNEVGILGHHPDDNKIIFALGFSHLGMQHAPAIGRAVMEMIVYDDYRSLDLTRYEIQNLWKKQHEEAERKRQELLENKERVAITD